MFSTQNVFLLAVLLQSLAQGSIEETDIHDEPPYHHRFKSRLPKEYIILSSEEDSNTYSDGQMSDRQSAIPKLISFTQPFPSKEDPALKEIRRSPPRSVPPQAKIPPPWRRKYTQLDIQPIQITKHVVLENLNFNRTLPISHPIPKNIRFLRSKHVSIRKIEDPSPKPRELGVNTVVEKHRSEGPLLHKRRKYRKRSSRRQKWKRTKDIRDENSSVFIPRQPRIRSHRLSKEIEYDTKGSPSKKFSDSRQKIPTLPLRPISDEMNERKSALEYEINKLNRELENLENRLKETDESTEQTIGDRIELDEQRELKKKYQHAIDELIESTAKPFIEPATISEDDEGWSPLKYYVKDGIVYERAEGRRVAGVSTQDRAIPIVSREGQFIGPKNRVESSPLVAEVQWELGDDESYGYARTETSPGQSIFRDQRNGFMFPIGLNHPPIPIPKATLYTGPVTSTTITPITTMGFSTVNEPFPIPDQIINPHPKIPFAPPTASPFPWSIDQAQNSLKEIAIQEVDETENLPQSSTSNTINSSFPSQNCYSNRDGYMCCNERLEVIMRKSFSKLRRRLGEHGCSVQLIANQIQKDAETMFGVPFETVASIDDFAIRAHFVADLTCKIQQDGRFVAAYATATLEAFKMNSRQKIAYDPKEEISIPSTNEPVDQDLLNQFIEEEKVDQRTTVQIPEGSTPPNLPILPFGTGLQAEEGLTQETISPQQDSTTTQTPPEEPRLTFTLSSPFKSLDKTRKDPISIPKYATDQELFPLPERIQQNGVRTVTMSEPIEF